MRTSRTTVLSLWLLASLAGAAVPALAQGVSGVVLDQNTALPIGGAIVSLQATTERTVSLPDGTFDLPGAQGPAMVIVASEPSVPWKLTNSLTR